MWQGTSTDLGILSGKIALGPVEEHRIGNPVPLGIDQHERNAVHGLGRPVRKDQPLDLGIGVEEHVAGADDRGRLGQVERLILASLGQKRQQIVDVGGLDLLLKAFGHERLLGRGHLVDVRALEDMPLPFGVDQLDRVLGLRREETGDDTTVGRRHGVLDEVPLDAPTRVEDVDQKLASRDGCHAGEVGTDLAPFGSVLVALGALLLEDELASGGISPFLDQRGDPIDHLLAIRVREAAALRQQLLGSLGDLAVGMGGQGLFLVEGQLGEQGRVFFECRHDGRAPVGPAEQYPDHAGSHAG